MNFPLSTSTPDDLKILEDKTFKSPSVWHIFKELIHPKPRNFDCLQVEVTSHCAAKCLYCPHTTLAESWQGKHMQIQTFANLWPLLQQSTRIHLQGWGEPLLHKNFFDFVAFARKADCLVSSTSCGLSLTQKTAENILNSGMDIIAFSLAGSDAQSNAVRMGANFNTVCENIKNFEALRRKKMAVHLQVHLAYILLADRILAVLQLPELMQELNVSTAIISTLDFVPNAGLEPLALPAHKTKELAFAQEILAETQEKAHKLDLQIHYALPSNKAASQCRENIQKSLYVSAEGNISPCVYLNIPTKSTLNSYQDQAIFGNVNSEHVLDIWNSSHFKSFRENHIQGCPSHILCQNCVKRFESLQTLII